MAKKMKQKIRIQGTGNTCIFFHSSCLSQHALEGKHPSSKKVMLPHHINISLKERLVRKSNSCLCEALALPLNFAIFSIAKVAYSNPAELSALAKHAQAPTFAPTSLKEEPIKENGMGTLQSSVICAYSEPSGCFLTISAAPFTMANNTFHYINFSETKEAANG